MSALPAGFKQHPEHQFPFDTSSVEQILKHYAITPTRVVRADRGTENETIFVDYVDKRFALRVYRRFKKTSEEILEEVEFMQFLRSRDFPVPEIIINRKGNAITHVTIGGVRWQCIVMTLMPGLHPESLSDAMLNEIAHIQGRLHQLGLEYANILRHRNIQPKTRAVRHGLSNLLYPAQRALKFGSPMGFTHFDLTVDNILALNGHITSIIDFDEANYDAVVDCLAVALTCLPGLVHDTKRQLNYLRQYQRVRPLGHREMLRLRAILLAKPERK
jgi:Ser/Thr protein kinase RdoA (MazF antagonist)